MSACPPMRVTNSTVYSTIKGILEKLSWNVLFAFSYLQMLSNTLPFIVHYVFYAGMDRGAAILMSSATTQFRSPEGEGAGEGGT